MAAKKKTVKEETVEKVIATVAGGDLNIRPEASTDKAPVGILKDGQEIEILEVGKDWCRIKEGFVMTQFLAF